MNFARLSNVMASGPLSIGLKSQVETGKVGLSKRGTIAILNETVALTRCGRTQAPLRLKPYLDTLRSRTSLQEKCVGQEKSVRILKSDDYSDCSNGS